jgi:hypothetical protein
MDDERGGELVLWAPQDDVEWQHLEEEDLVAYMSRALQWASERLDELCTIEAVVNARGHFVRAEQVLRDFDVAHEARYAVDEILVRHTYRLGELLPDDQGGRPSTETSPPEGRFLNRHLREDARGLSKHSKQEFENAIGRARQELNITVKNVLRILNADAPKQSAARAQPKQPKATKAQAHAKAIITAKLTVQENSKYVLDMVMEELAATDKPKPYEVAVHVLSELERDEPDIFLVYAREQATKNLAEFTKGLVNARRQREQVESKRARFNEEKEKLNAQRKESNG